MDSTEARPEFILEQRKTRPANVGLLKVRNDFDSCVRKYERQFIREGQLKVWGDAIRQIANRCKHNGESVASLIGTVDSRVIRVQRDPRGTWVGSAPS